MKQRLVTLKDLNEEKRQLGCNRVGTTANYIICKMLFINTLNNTTNGKHSDNNKEE